MEIKEKIQSIDTYLKLKGYTVTPSRILIIFFIAYVLYRPQEFINFVMKILNI